MRHYLLMANYTLEKVRNSGNLAATAAFIEAQSVTGLAKNPATVECLEDLLREGREKYLPILERQLSRTQALLEFADYGVVLVRSALAKPLPDPFQRKGNAATARFGKERAAFLGTIWASQAHARHPDLEFPKVAGLLPAVADGVDKEAVSLESLAAERAGDGGDLSGSATLRPGDDVVVIRRFTWQIPLEGNAEYRKDVTVGTSGRVIGFADQDHRQVLLTIFAMSLPGPRGAVRKDVTDKAWPKNLKLKEEYENLVAATPAACEDADGESPGPSAPAARRQVGGAWAFLQDPELGPATVEKQWPKLLDHEGSSMQGWFLRGRAAFAAQAILEALPHYGAQDLCVVHRETPKGGKKLEVWTRKDFGPRELIVPALSPDLRECLWTKNLHAFIGLPKNGPGKHPEGKSLAMDGRGRNVLASAGTIDDKEKLGNLLWCVERTADASLANLVVESIQVSATCELTIPSAKRRKVSVQRPSSEMPALPVFVNLKAIPAHTRLYLRHEAQGDEGGAKPKGSGAASSSAGC